MTSDSLTTRPDGQSDGMENDLLELYLAGKLTADATERVERWLDMHAPARRVVESFRDRVAEVEVVVPEAHRMVERLRARRYAGGQRQLPVGWGGFKGQPLWRGLFPRQSVWRWTSYAAAALLFGVLGIAIGRHRQTHATDGRIRGIGSTYTTANGERANITLPDGSTAALDVASRLTVPADYAAGNHTVRLEGQALFTVSHHDATPFTVLTRITSTRVLGTQFLVRQFSTDTTATIAVAEGRVAVGKVVITASQAISVGRTGVAHIEVADPSQFGFVNGVLALDSVPLSTAIHDLDRWYDVDLRLGDPRLATLPIIGEFTAGTVADVADVLEGTFGLRIVRDGRILTLYPRVR